MVRYRVRDHVADHAVVVEGVSRSTDGPGGATLARDDRFDHKDVVVGTRADGTHAFHRATLRERGLLAGGDLLAVGGSVRLEGTVAGVAELAGDRGHEVVALADSTAA